MIVYDFPRDRRLLYQSYLTVSIWMWSAYQVLFMCVEFTFARDNTVMTSYDTGI